MASDPTFVDLVVSQIEFDGEVHAKKMFGDYGVFAGGKMFGLICDNRFLIKPTDTGRVFAGKLPEAEPYPGAKLCFLMTDKMQDREWLGELVRITVEALPVPKKRKPKRKP